MHAPVVGAGATGAGATGATKQTKHVGKEPCIYGKRALIYGKRALIYGKRALIYGKRAPPPCLPGWQKKATTTAANMQPSMLPCRPSTMSPRHGITASRHHGITASATTQACVYETEANVYGKRDLYTWQKRPIYMIKETFIHGKRDLPDLRIWKKRTM